MEEKEYEALIDMFASEGWAIFIRSAEDLNKALTQGAVDGATTNDQWQYLRGQLGQLRSILGYQAFIEAAWKQQNEPVPEEDTVDVDSI